MKINKIKSYNFKLLKLKLIKTKIYKKKHNDFIKIKSIANRLKKSLHIIYNYHKNNKKILFIGTLINSDARFKKFLRNTKHALVPELLWMNGSVTNKLFCFKYLSKNKKLVNRKISEILFKIKAKSDLIVVLNPLNNSSVINESYLARTPIISINYNFNSTVIAIKSSYKIPGNFQFKKKKIRDAFLYSLIILVLKRADKNLKLRIKKKKL